MYGGAAGISIVEAGGPEGTWELVGVVFGCKGGWGTMSGTLANWLWNDQGSFTYFAVLPNKLVGGKCDRKKSTGYIVCMLPMCAL